MDRTGYTGLAKTFHWLAVLFVFVLFPLAWAMDVFPLFTNFLIYNWHKSIGLSVLTLTILRAIWRGVNPAPALPATIPFVERAAAYAVHLALYATLILMPLTGWAMVSFSKFPSILFPGTVFQTAIPLIPSWSLDVLNGVSAISGIELPPPEDKNAYEDIFKGAHGLLANALMALIAIHILAALRHAVFKKDGVISRMMPRFLANARKAKIALAIGLGAVFAFAFAPPGFAANWSIDIKKSKAQFEATGSGYTTRGAFGKYDAEILFDPDEPSAASVRVTLDMKSVTTGTADVDGALQTPEYFDTAKYPYADFVAKGFRAGKEGQYVFDGQLTLKGITKPMKLLSTIAIVDGIATVKAEATLNRMEFGAGPASVAGLSIDPEVKVSIDMTALRLDN